MNAQEIIDYIANSEKRTPVKLYVNTTGPVDFGNAQVFVSFSLFWRQTPRKSRIMWWRMTAAIPACHYWICGRFQPALNPVPSSGKRWKLERARSS